MYLNSIPLPSSRRSCASACSGPARPGRGPTRAATELLRALLAAVIVALGAPAVAAAAGGSPVSAGPVSVTQTAPSLGQFLAPLAPLSFTSTVPPAGMPLVALNERASYQRVTGFGAAMTDSSAWLLETKLSPATRDQVMAELFGVDGLRLDFLRVPIGATDFTATGVPYSYDDLPAGQRDPTLRHFSIAHDEAYILPALLQARTLEPQLQLLATPWSPPAWMKGNDSLSNARNRGTLLGSAYRPWAAYIVRFLQAYARAGVPVAALTPQNEPGVATSYPGLALTPHAEAVWLRQDLVPALAAAGLHLQLYGSELGWGSPGFAQQLLADPVAGELTGLSWHCYYGSPTVMSQLHAMRPALGTIVDECSPGISAIPTSEVVISSLRNWAGTVALWNLALNLGGGPVELPNTGCRGCYGLVKINEDNGWANREVPYFQLGQASEFIEPGARRIGSTSSVTYTYTRPGVNFISAGIDDVAVVNPDGSRVLLAYNNSSAPITFAARWRGRYFRYRLPAGATATFRWTL
jgi:glucosylceramidase